MPRRRRSIQPDARFRFVNVAQWESAQALQAAHGDGFRKLVTQLAWAEFRSIPAHYEVVSENRSERESRASARA